MTIFWYLALVVKLRITGHASIQPSRRVESLASPSDGLRILGYSHPVDQRLLYVYLRCMTPIRYVRSRWREQSIRGKSAEATHLLPLVALALALALAFGSSGRRLG